MNKDNSIEVFSPQESATILQRCEEKIETAYGHLRRGEQLNEGLRFVIGAQMNAAKPHITHGQFEDWLKERFPKIDIRTAQNWMKFADTVGTVVGKSKNETVSFLKNTPLQLTQGEFDWQADLRAVTEAVSTLMGEDGMMDFIDKHAEKARRGGSRQIGFSCPHCGRKNKGFLGRTIVCANKDCAERITVRADGPTPAEKTQRMVEAEEEVLGALLASAEMWKLREDRSLANLGLLARAEQVFAEMTAESRRLLKLKKGGRA